MVQGNSIELPEGSLYHWMYKQGLKHVKLDDIEDAVKLDGRTLRPKDIQNYWNGWYNRTLYREDNPWCLKKEVKYKSITETVAFDELEKNSLFGYPDIENRFVPCNQDNKPMIKWSQGCMTRADAECYPGCVYLAENMKGTSYIVIDCDGDHGDELDAETITFLGQWLDKTHAMIKPGGIPVSFHLMFKTDKLIRTRHFPEAHIDVLGNEKNQLRYIKNKKWNGKEPAVLTGEIWNELMEFVNRRREKANGDNSDGSADQSE